MEKCCSGTVYNDGKSCCPTGKYISGNQCCSLYTYSFYHHSGNGAGTRSVGSYTVPKGDCGSGSYTATLSTYCIDDIAYVYVNGSQVATLSACNVLCTDSNSDKCYSKSWSGTVKAGDVISVDVWGKYSKHGGDTDFQGTLTLSPR